MTYDIHGTWDPLTDFNAPLYSVEHSPKLQSAWSVDTAVRLWLDSGMPAGKIVLGIPFYGMKYNAVTNANNGYYQDFTSGWAIAYSDIADKYLNQPGMKRYFHPVAKVPWLFDGTTMISYDDPESIAFKVDYIREHDLGGAMFWQISHDNGTLLKALNDEMD
jgi:chitinase